LASEGAKQKAQSMKTGLFLILVPLTGNAGLSANIQKKGRSPAKPHRVAICDCLDGLARGSN